MKPTSSVVDCLNTSLLSDAVSPKRQFENTSDKSQDPVHPGSPYNAPTLNKKSCTSRSITIDPICLNDQFRRSETIGLSFVSKGYTFM